MSGGVPPRRRIGIPRMGLHFTVLTGAGCAFIFAFCQPDYDNEGLEAKLRNDIRLKASRQANPNFQADGVKAMLKKNEQGELDDLINPKWKKEPEVPKEG